MMMQNSLLEFSLSRQFVPLHRGVCFTMPYWEVSSLTYDQFMQVCSIVNMWPKGYPIMFSEVVSETGLPAEEVEQIAYMLLLYGKIKVTPVTRESDQLIYYLTWKVES